MRTLQRGFTSEEELSLVGRVFGAEASVFLCGHCSLRVQALEDKRKGGEHFPSNRQPPTRHCAASCHQATASFFTSLFLSRFVMT